MMKTSLSLIFILIALAAAPSIVGAQVVGADDRPLFSKHNDEDRPKSIQEGLVKMRIEKEKKEHEEMISRAEDAAQLAADLQESFARTGRLSSDDLSKASKIEKLVKKVRDDLGGDGDGDTTDKDSDDDQPAEAPVPNSLPAAVDALKAKAAELSEQLKLTTRFTISADAIQNTNTLLKIIKVVKTRQ